MIVVVVEVGGVGGGAGGSDLLCGRKLNLVSGCANFGSRLFYLVD